MEHAHWHLVMVLALLVGLIALPVWGDEPAAIQRGKAVLQAAGGCSCHTDDKHSGAFLGRWASDQNPFWHDLQHEYHARTQDRHWYVG